MLKVFVINLATSEQRRDKVSKRLTNMGLAFELFPAVDGRETPHPLFEKYDEKKCLRHRRKGLSGGELGCFASHYLLWKKCVDLNEPIVVMEDDVYITNAFIRAVEQAEKLMHELSYIRLAGTSLHRRPYKKLRSEGEFDLIDHVRGPSGTLCYVLSPKGARALLDNAQTWYQAVDDYMDRYWGHGVDCYSLMPFSVLVADNESDIARFDKPKTNVLKKLVQELNGRVDRTRRMIYRVSKG